MVLCLSTGVIVRCCDPRPMPRPHSCWRISLQTSGRGTGFKVDGMILTVNAMHSMKPRYKILTGVGIIRGDVESHVRTASSNGNYYLHKHW